MNYKVNFDINDEFVQKVLDEKSPEVTLDITEKEYLASREVTELLILSKQIGNLFLKNANEHIIDTIEVLKLQKYLKVIS